MSFYYRLHILQSVSPAHAVLTHGVDCAYINPKPQGMTRSVCAQHVWRNVSSCTTPNTAQCSFVFSRRLTGVAVVLGDTVTRPLVPNWVACVRMLDDVDGSQLGCMVSDVEPNTTAGTYKVGLWDSCSPLCMTRLVV